MAKGLEPPVYTASLLSGAAISVAWWFPDTLASALLGWVAACLLVYAVRARRAYLPAYCCGLVCCALGFYWVFRTVAEFSGLGTIPAALLFALFVIGSATQFLVLAFVHNNLGPFFERYALRAAVALVVSELVSIRIFFWNYGHTQIALTHFVQIADVAGALTVSFLLFWLAEAGVRFVVFRERSRALLLPVAALGVALVYGFAMVRKYSTPSEETQEVVLVQGNFPPSQHTEPATGVENAGRLVDSSRAVARPNALVVWPETSLPFLFPASIRSAREEPLLPQIEGAALLLGAFSEDASNRRRIAAWAIQPDGGIPAPYSKQVLIPFGEYTPGSTVLPWLETINANTGGFTPGTEATVFEYPLRRDDGSPYTLRVSPLICYEDTIPRLSRQATRNGAGLLVNLTNDAWFGRTAAPYEHHLIASFRAIENRRFLVRATNTGVTSVVDPLGRTIARLPVFSEGTLTARVALIKETSLYTKYFGEWPWWGLSLVVVVDILVTKRAFVNTRSARPAAGTAGPPGASLTPPR